jgi:carboxyl-terminal processing protease
MRWFPLFVFAVVANIPLHSETEDTANDLPDEGEGYQHVERFITILEEVRAHHPDADKVSYERLVNHALEGMLDSLDPFSSFYHPETVAAFDPDTPLDKPQFTVPSLGITLGKRDNRIYFSRIRKNSPAARVGFQDDDQLLNKGNESLSTLELPQAQIALQGSAGETISLTVLRESSREKLTHKVTHAVVKQPALPDAYLLENTKEKTIGYARLTEFTALAPRELEAALDELEDQGMEALILDLRGNPGGLLSAAVDILGLFLPPDTEVVTTRGRSSRAEVPPLKTPERQRVKRDYPLAILIDRNSASASELVAGALQDLDRATIIGEQSFGKGSVQNIIRQPGGTALRLTFATYHTPSGKTPHEVGITPDLEIDIIQNDLAQFERFKIRKTASEATLVKLAEWKDPAINAAVKKLR